MKYARLAPLSVLLLAVSASAVTLDAPPRQGPAATPATELFGADLDDSAFTPLSTGGLRLFGQRYVQSITVQVADAAAIDRTQEAIRALLLSRHRGEDFQTRSMAAILATANSASSGVVEFNAPRSRVGSSGWYLSST